MSERQVHMSARTDTSGASADDETQFLMSNDGTENGTVRAESSNSVDDSNDGEIRLHPLVRPKPQSDLDIKFLSQKSRPTSFSRRINWANRLKETPKDTERPRNTRNATLEDRGVIVRPVHGQTRGYPELATFLDSDERFMICRRFGYVQTRLLLEKQDDLRILEEALDELDLEDTAENIHALCSRRDIEEHHFKRRRELLYSLETKFCEYAKLMEAAKTMTSMQKPAQIDIKSLQTWMDNERPLVHAERSWVSHEEDLITLKTARPSSWLENTIENVANRYLTFLQRPLQSNIERLKTSPLHYSYYYCKDRVEFAALVITAAFLAFVILASLSAAWIASMLVSSPHTGRDETRIQAGAGALLAADMILVVLFTSVVSRCTRATRLEVTFSTLSYLAFLYITAITFLGGWSTVQPVFAENGFNVFNMTVWNMTTWNLTQGESQGQLMF